MVEKKNFFKKKSLVSGLIVALVFVSGFVVYFAFFYRQKTEVCFEKFCFQAEVAKSSFAVSRGLMFRKNLGEKEAMLFVFARPGIYPFWLKNTLIPLDIIWLDRDKKAVDIKKNLQPCYQEQCPVYANQNSAQYVLEINAGLADEIGLEIGSSFSF